MKLSFQKDALDITKLIGNTLVPIYFFCTVKWVSFPLRQKNCIILVQKVFFFFNLFTIICIAKLRKKNIKLAHGRFYVFFWIVKLQNCSQNKKYTHMISKACVSFHYFYFWTVWELFDNFKRIFIVKKKLMFLVSFERWLWDCLVIKNNHMQRC